jgi:hypothetical protein
MPRLPQPPTLFILAVKRSYLRHLTNMSVDSWRFVEFEFKLPGSRIYAHAVEPFQILSLAVLPAV